MEKAKMEYREMITKMINSIDSSVVLRYIYIIIKDIESEVARSDKEAETRCHKDI